MKYISTILLTSLLLTFCKCTQPTKIKSEQDIVVDLDVKTNTSVFDLVDSISVVPIETSDSCLIASINQIQKKGDTLYIYDARQSILFCLNTQGKLLFHINEKGDGPGQYQYIGDFTVSNTGEIYLLEPWGNIYHFNSKGTFKEKITLPRTVKSFNEIYIANSSLVLISIWGDILTYSLNNKEYKIHHLYERMNTFFPIKRSYEYNDKVFTTSLFTNQITNISNQNFSIEWQWNFLKANNNRKKINKLIKEQSNYDPQKKEEGIPEFVGRNKPLNQFIYTSFETSRYKAAFMEYENNFLHVFFDKKTNENKVFVRTKENTIFHPCNYSDGALLYCKRNYIQNWRDITCINEEILRHSGLSINNDDSEENNPIIVIFHLKK